MNSFIEGAIKPLLSVWRRPLALAGILLLTACSHDTSLPPFTASGYADNQGAMRIWRKDSGDEVHLLAAFSPWRHGDTSTSEYRWQGDQLALIELNVYGKPPEHIRARVRRAGRSELYATGSGRTEAAALQRPVALYRYRAEQIRQTSDALRRGGSSCAGRWNAAAHTVLTCEGQTVTPDLDSRARRTLNAARATLPPQ
ncbi:DUF1481 domain-containing protein [Klebsiella pneumoniae]|uniref:DUF1481 domain-containing protein n=1 Tax=Klebsiella pneumoniae TaxID=573 RepID=A0A5C2LKG4_KLEPN|nr:DUF1481 domain-containing protein [Klebsiella pneumoniae]